MASEPIAVPPLGAEPNRPGSAQAAEQWRPWVVRPPPHEFLFEFDDCLRIATSILPLVRRLWRRLLTRPTARISKD